MTRSLIEANLTFLRQASDLLERMTPELYRTGNGELSPVGSHLRHILDHYQSLISGAPSGRVDYDDRKRNSRLERDPDAAAKAVAEVMAALSNLATGGNVQVKMNHGGSTTEWSQSSVERELQFLVSHTVHHFALMKAVLQRSNVPLNADFGVAPSTLAYRSDNSCAH